MLKIKREKQYERLKWLTTTYDGEAKKMDFYIYKGCEKNLAIYKTSVYESFFGARIMNSFAFVRIQPTSEKVWRTLFQVVMLQRQTMMGIKREDEMITFEK